MYITGSDAVREKIYELAQSNPTVLTFLMYYKKKWLSWDAMMVELVSALCKELDATQEQLEKIVEHGVPPIIIETSKSKDEILGR